MGSIAQHSPLGIQEQGSPQVQLLVGTGNGLGKVEHFLIGGDSLVKEGRVHYYPVLGLITLALTFSSFMNKL